MGVNFPLNLHNSSHTCIVDRNYRTQRFAFNVGVSATTPLGGFTGFVGFNGLPGFGK